MSHCLRLLRLKAKLKVKKGYDFHYCYDILKKRVKRSLDSAKKGKRRSKEMEEKKKLATGLTVWLWIVFIINIITTLLAVVGTIGASALGLGGAYVVVCVLSVILEIVLIVGVAMMLFAHKKAGFFVVVAAAVLGLVVNLVTYNMTGDFTGANIAKSIISAVVAPLIIYLLAKKDMENGVLA